MYLIKNQLRSLLSIYLSLRLSPVVRKDTRLEEVIPTLDYGAEFSKLFLGLGKMKTKYHITFKLDTNPICLYAPKKVAHPLLAKVNQKLDKMIQQGLTSPINETTR